MAKKRSNNKYDESILTIVVATRKSAEEMQDVMQRYCQTLTAKNTKIQFITLHNDGRVSLSNLYAQAMDGTIASIQGGIIVFCHDDIDFLKKGWDDELYRLFQNHKDYGIIGVAGSAEFDEGAAWWNYQKKYGQVLHRHDGKSWLTAFSPLLDKDLQEVCVIDGLFMAVNRNRVSKNFDKELPGFDFYDIDFCLANYLDGKTKIGVTTNIRIAHNSIGQLSEGWHKNREVINEKYKEHYPIKVK